MPDDHKFSALGELDDAVQRSGYHSAKFYEEMGLKGRPAMPGSHVLKPHQSNAAPKSVIEGIDICRNGGCVKRVLKPGGYPNPGYPGKGAFVTLHYVGTRMDGMCFDKSCNFNHPEKAGRPFGFILGKGDALKGWEKGIATMQQGEIACLVLRSDYAYGSDGDRPDDDDGIPRYATLRFEIECLGWEGGAPGTGRARSSMCALL